MKVLGTGWGSAVNWLDIEVMKHRGARPEIILHGKANAYADALGIQRFHLALTHTATLAEAQVVAEGDSVEGAYVPTQFQPQYDDHGHLISLEYTGEGKPCVRRRFINNLDDYPTASQILTPETVFGDMYLGRRGDDSGVPGAVYPGQNRQSESGRQTPGPEYD